MDDVNDVHIEAMDEKVAEMFDTHLINVALAGLSISAGVAILIAAAIIGIAALRLRRKPHRDGIAGGSGGSSPRAGTVSATPASAPGATQPVAERLAA